MNHNDKFARKVARVALAAVCAVLLAGCAPLSAGFVTAKDGVYTLTIPEKCGLAIDNVIVFYAGGSEDDPNLWTAKAKTGEASNHVALFQPNDGYTTEGDVSKIDFSRDLPLGGVKARTTVPVVPLGCSPISAWMRCCGPVASRRPMIMKRRQWILRSACKAIEASTVREQGQYVLRPVPCNASGFTSVTVKDPSSGEYYGQMTTLWDVKSANGKGASEVVLFAASQEYDELVHAAVRPDGIKPILVTFEMLGYDAAGGFSGDLAALRDGEALTSDGVVPMEHVENWSCG